MTRKTVHHLAFGSASALAIAAVLAACSQPASYATVDLSGSYSSNPVDQAYSPVTGQPVYTETALYGPQSFPDLTYVPEAQLAYVDAPTDQVASLGYSDAGVDLYPPAPSYQAPQPRSWSPVISESPLLSRPEFQTEITQAEPLGQYQHMGALDAPAPVTAPSPFEPAPYAPAPYADAPYSPAPPDFAPPQSIETAPLDPIAPVAALPQPAPQPDIETVHSVPFFHTPGEPIYRPGPISDAVDSEPLDDFEDPFATAEPVVSDDYATLDRRSAGEQPRRIVPPQDRQYPPARDSYDPDGAYVSEARDIVPPRPQQTRLPAPTAVPRAPFGGALTVPKASDAYPRPYELLKPGIYPPLDGAGEGMVQAPETTPIPLIAFVRQMDEAIDADPQPRVLASERLTGTYEIQKGDTLFAIAQKIGIAVDELRVANDLSADSTIYAGSKLVIPAEGEIAAAPRRAKPDIELAKSVEPDATAAPSYEYRYAFDEDGTDRGTADLEERIQSLMSKLDALEKSSESRADAAQQDDPAAKFLWPVHGEVYRLKTGQIEIDPSGNPPVAAVAAGKVVHVEHGPLGILVVIEHDNGWRSLTVGLDEAKVSAGDTVRRGARIGIASREHRVRFELRDAARDVTDALSHLAG